jgi:hypothetical protein
VVVFGLYLEIVLLDIHQGTDYLGGFHGFPQSYQVNCLI